MGRFRNSVWGTVLVCALGACGAPARQGYSSNQPEQSSDEQAGETSGEGDQAEASSSSDGSDQAAEAPAGPSCTPDGRIEPNGGPTCCSGHRACDNYNVCTCCQADGHTCL